MRTMMPLYTWTGDPALYNARTAHLNPGDIAIVTSGNNGPTPYNPALLQHIQELDERGILTFGYVATGYGSRSIRDVLKDITDWRHYGVRRIFLDEWAATMKTEIGLMWGAIRGYGGRGTTERPIVICNMGTPFATLATVPPGTLIVVWENTDPPPPTIVPRPWEAVIVHSNPNADTIRADLAAAGWQWGYATSDGADGNPFDELSSQTP